jgi:hypothetical protein
METYFVRGKQEEKWCEASHPTINSTLFGEKGGTQKNGMQGIPYPRENNWYSHPQSLFDFDKAMAGQGF